MLSRSWPAASGALACALAALWLAGCAPKPLPETIVNPYEEAMRAAKDWQGAAHPLARQLFEQGMERYRAGDWAQAAALLGQAADLDVVNFSQRPEALIFQAQALRRLNQQTEAARVARTAIHDYPERWEPRLLLAEYYLSRDNNEAAERELATAARLAPTRPEVLKTLARIDLSRGQLLPALDAARRALDAAPGDADAAALVASIYVQHALQAERERALDSALASLYAAAALRPDDPLPPLLVGRALLQLNLPRAARRYTELGRRKLRDPARAPREAFAVEAISTEDDAASCLRMAEFYRERHQPDAAEGQLALALAADFRSVEAWRALGLLRTKEQQDPAGARQCLSALWILEPGGAHAKELEAALALKDEAETPPTPGFVSRTQLGAGFDSVKRVITEEAAVFKAGTRLYFALTLARAAGPHKVQWRVLDEQGRAVGEMSWDAELFDRDFVFGTTGAWAIPGRYEAVWLMDGLERRRTTFELK